MIRPVHIASFALLSACGGGDPVPAPDTGSTAAVVGDTLIRPAEVPDHFRLLDSMSADVDGDGAPERVDLAAAVGVDGEGRFQWDDGQEWLVAVRDGPDTYPLLREHLHWGSAAFWIVGGDSAAPPAILVLTEWLHYPDAGTRMQKYVFDRPRGGYVRTGSVDARGDLTRFRGPPPGSGIEPWSFHPPSKPDNPPE